MEIKARVYTSIPSPPHLRLRWPLSDEACTSGQLVVASRESQYKVLHFHRGGLDKLADVFQQWKYCAETRLRDQVAAEAPPTAGRVHAPCSRPGPVGCDARCRGPDRAAARGWNRVPRAACTASALRSESPVLTRLPAIFCSGSIQM